MKVSSIFSNNDGVRLSFADTIKRKSPEGRDRIKQNKVLSCLVGNVVEVSEAQLSR